MNQDYLCLLKTINLKRLESRNYYEANYEHEKLIHFIHCGDLQL